MEFHSLLKRQLKHLGTDIPPELKPFFETVNRAYFEFEEDRKMLERSMELSSQELQQANGDLRKILSQLGQEKMLLQNILVAIPHHVFWKDRQCVYLGCSENFAKVAGLKFASEIVGKTDYDLAWKREEADFFRKIDQEVMKKGEPLYNLEESQLQAGGREATLLTSKVPLRNDAGEVIGILGIYTDITEKKQIESHLLQSQKIETVGTLAGGIAHDLNNQLTPLLGYLDLLSKLPSADSEQRLFLDEAAQAAIRCAYIVRRLLNFAHPSSEKKAAFRFETVLDELRKLLPKFLPSTIKTQITAQATLWPVRGNETEIQSVFMNLAANARDAMPAGGTLSIRARNIELSETLVRAGFPAGRYLAVEVRDTGSGIPPNVLTRIFEPFFTTKKVGEGTGLGLAMVFNILKDHKGWIDATSAIGNGTTFEIFMPAAENAAELKTNGHGALPAISTDKNLTVLLADDEEVVRMLACRFLERLGYRVLMAKDGPEAIDLFRQNRRDISAVILDMTMPRMTGIETLRKILEISPSTPVILCSGYTVEGSPEELLRVGAKAFIQKPYTIDDLAKTLQQHLLPFRPD